MGNATRIYEKHVDIKKDTVQDFWNKRAKKHIPENPYISVKCNDQNPDYAKNLDKYEKEIIEKEEFSKIEEYMLNIGEY